MVKIGAYTSIGDKATINTVSSLASGIPATCDVGDFTTIGTS